MFIAKRLKSTSRTPMRGKTARKICNKYNERGIRFLNPYLRTDTQLDRLTAVMAPSSVVQ